MSDDLCFLLKFDFKKWFMFRMVNFCETSQLKNIILPDLTTLDRHEANAFLDLFDMSRWTFFDSRTT